MELPKTEAELQAIIDASVKEAVDKATSELVSKHNGEMASLRTKQANEIEKIRKEANMSAEELAEQRAREQAQANEQELNDLRAFKKETTLKEKLAKAELPAYLINDRRLWSAEEGEIDKVIKTVKGEYEATQPKGNTHSTVVNVGGGNANTPKGNSNQDTAQQEAYSEAGQVIGELFK